MQVMTKEYQRLLERNRIISQTIAAGTYGFQSGKTIHSNPYKRGDHGWFYWHKGFKDAEQAAAQAAQDAELNTAAELYESQQEELANMEMEKYLESVAV